MQTFLATRKPGSICFSSREFVAEDVIAIDAVTQERINLEGEFLVTNRVDGKLIPTPAVRGGELWIRARDRLYVVGGKKG